MFGKAIIEIGAIVVSGWHTLWGLLRNFNIFFQAPFDSVQGDLKDIVTQQVMLSGVEA